MGLLGRIRTALASKLDALLEKATDPGKQLDSMLLEMREHMKAATAELIEYKATEKRLAQRVTELQAAVATARGRAEQAVRAGQDDLARAALVEEQRLKAEQAQVERERAEMAGYAAELLRARRSLDQRIKELELKKGTLAQDLRVARGRGSAVAAEGAPWEALERAEAIISEEAVLADLDAELGDPLAEGDAATEARFREKMKEARAEADLAELKRKMGK